MVTYTKQYYGLYLQALPEVAFLLVNTHSVSPFLYEKYTSMQMMHTGEGQ